MRYGTDTTEPSRRLKRSYLSPVWVLGIALLATMLGVPAALAKPATWTVDPVHSHVGFSVRHFLTQVPGRFNEVSGTIVYDADDLERSGVELVVAAASVDTNNPERDRHLRSKDFFDVEHYPTLTFKSTRVVDDDGVLMITGQLKLRGRVENVIVPVQVIGVMDTPQGPKAGFSATFHINRSDYGITWNEVLDQGTTVLGEVIKITVNLEAVPVAEKAP